MYIRKIIVLIFCIAINSCANQEDNKLFGQILGSAARSLFRIQVRVWYWQRFFNDIWRSSWLFNWRKSSQVLDNDEQKDLNETISNSLDKNKDSETEEWTSTKNSGTKAEVIPLNKYEIDEKTCRDFKKIISKDEKIIEEESTACRDEREIGKLFSGNFYCRHN